MYHIYSLTLKDLDRIFLVLTVEHTLFNRWDTLPLHFHLQFRRHLLSLDWSNNPWPSSRLQVRKTWLDGPYLKAGYIFHKFRSKTSETEFWGWNTSKFILHYSNFCKNENDLKLRLRCGFQQQIKYVGNL